MTTVSEAESSEAVERPSPTDPRSAIYPFDEGQTDAIVVRCADPRFRRAFDMFVADLGIRHPATIAVTGSIKSFGLQAYVPKEWHALNKQLELIATRHSHVERVVLLTHEDCQSYRASAHLLGGMGRLVAHQRAHLQALAKYLHERYLSDAVFELYHARLVLQGAERSVLFERLGGTPTPHASDASVRSGRPKSTRE